MTPICFSWPVRPALTLLPLLLLPLGAIAAAPEATVYPPGHQALEQWNAEAMAAVPLPVKIWLNVMMVTFVASLAFVWRHTPARWVAAGVILSVGGGGAIANALGLVVLSGYVALLHLIFWSPGLVYLLRERAFTRGLSFYNVWAGWTTLVILISFVFDVRDATLYLRHMLG